MRLPVQAAIIAALAAGSAFADDWTKTFVVRPARAAHRDDDGMSPCGLDEKKIVVVSLRRWKIGPGEVEVGNPRPATARDHGAQPHRSFSFFNVGCTPSRWMCRRRARSNPISALATATST